VVLDGSSRAGGKTLRCRGVEGFGGGEATHVRGIRCLDREGRVGVLSTDFVPDWVLL
jgi:hypothetical protein